MKNVVRRRSEDPTPGPKARFPLTLQRRACHIGCRRYTNNWRRHDGIKHRPDEPADSGSNTSPDRNPVPCTLLSFQRPPLGPAAIPQPASRTSETEGPFRRTTEYSDPGAFCLAPSDIEGRSGLRGAPQPETRRTKRRFPSWKTRPSASAKGRSRESGPRTSPSILRPP